MCALLLLLFNVFVKCGRDLWCETVRFVVCLVVCVCLRMWFKCVWLCVVYCVMLGGLIVCLFVFGVCVCVLFVMCVV